MLWKQYCFVYLANDLYQIFFISNIYCFLDFVNWVGWADYNPNEETKNCSLRWLGMGLFCYKGFRDNLWCKNKDSKCSSYSKRWMYYCF